MTIRESTFKGMKSIVMESDELVAMLLPGLGSKMVSLVNKSTGREFLYQTAQDTFKRPSYGDAFVDFDVSGFDEMMPTVLECPYPDGPWKGVVLPDHGEVWTLPWDSAIGKDHVELWTYGVRLPYRFSKRLGFRNQSTLRIEYTLENLSQEDMKYIWCAHMLKACEEGTEILLPTCVKRIMTTQRTSERLGDFGTIHPWPASRSPSGEEVALNRIRSREAGQCDKFHVIDPLTEGWCAIRHPDTGEVLRLSFPAEKIPYLGIWISEGGLNGHYHLALEPASGSLDRVDTADQWNKGSTIPGKSIAEWYLEISISQPA